MVPYKRKSLTSESLISEVDCIRFLCHATRNNVFKEKFITPVIAVVGRVKRGN